VSRSYKKNPYCGQTQRPADKRIANHKVRQKLKNHLDWNIQNSDYKKLSESWLIRDYGTLATYEKWLMRLHKRRLIYPEDTEEELYAYWHKHYKRK
jgi:hypothetical protein